MTTTYSPEYPRTATKAAQSAKAIHSRMKAIGVEMTVAQAYEAVAAAAGFRNWATMKADLQKSGENVTIGERFAEWAASQPDDRAGTVAKNAAAGDTAAMASLCAEVGLVPLHFFDAGAIAAGFNARDAAKFEARFGEAEFLTAARVVPLLEAYVRNVYTAEAYEDFVQGYIEEVLDGSLPGQVDWLDAVEAERPAP